MSTEAVTKLTRIRCIPGAGWLDSWVEVNPVRRRLPLLALVLCLLGVSRVWAEPNGGLDEHARTLAERDAVPLKPLLRKIREGRAKGVAPARIRRAVSDLHRRLVEGRAVCGQTADALCLQAAADAIAAGGETAALTRLIARTPAEDTTRALVGFTSLSARGMAPDAAIAAVASAIESDRLDTLAAPKRPEIGPSTIPGRQSHATGLPVQDPARDRDQTGSAKLWGMQPPASAPPGGAPGNGNAGNGNGNAGNGNGNAGNGNAGNGNGNGNGNGGRGNGGRDDDDRDDDSDEGSDEDD